MSKRRNRRTCPGCLSAPEGQKHCHGPCDLVKPLKEFYNDNSTKDGRSSKCQECCKSDNKEYRERKIAEDPTWRQTRFIPWHSTHAEQLAQYRADWDDRNPEYRPEYQKKWRMEHAASVSAYGAVRRARKAGASVCEPINRLHVADLDNWECWLCLRPIPPDAPYLLPSGKRNPEYLVTEHVIPLAKNGVQAYSNVRASHAICNSMKSTKVFETEAELLEFRAMLLERVEFDKWIPGDITPDESWELPRPEMTTREWLDSLSDSQVYQLENDDDC